MVPIRITLHLGFGSSGVLSQDSIESLLELEHVLDRSLNVTGRSLRPSGNLVDHNVGIGQRVSLPACSCRKQNGPHACCHADAIGINVTSEELESVVDGKS